MSLMTYNKAATRRRMCPPFSIQVNRRACPSNLNTDSSLCFWHTMLYFFLLLAASHPALGLSVPFQHQPRLPVSLPFALKLGQLPSIPDYDRSRIHALKNSAQSPNNQNRRAVFPISDVSINASTDVVSCNLIIAYPIADRYSRPDILPL